MTYIVNDSCIRCKHMDCVTVCPVDCFYEGESMLVINTDECIDCGVCEPECPADAIRPDTADGAAVWVAHNQKYAELWPRLHSCEKRMFQQMLLNGMVLLIKCVSS
jgi:ferredoxin